MNAAEKVAALEALLAKVQNNASQPRPLALAGASFQAAVAPVVAAQRHIQAAPATKDEDVELNFEMTPKPVAVSPPIHTTEASPKAPVVATRADASPRPAIVAAKAEVSPKPPLAATKPSTPLTAEAARAAIAARAVTTRSAAVDPPKPIAAASSAFDELDELDEPTIARDISGLLDESTTVVQAPGTDDLARTRVADPRAEDLARAKAAEASLAKTAATPAAKQEPTAKPAPIVEEATVKQTAAPMKAFTPKVEPVVEARSAPVMGAPRRQQKATLMGVGIADLEALQKQLEPKTEEVDEAPAPEPSIAPPAEPLYSPDEATINANRASEPALKPLFDSAPATEVLPSMDPSDFEPPPKPTLPVAEPQPAPMPSEGPFIATLASEGDAPEVRPQPAAPPVAAAPNVWAEDAANAKLPPKKASSGSAWVLAAVTALLVGAGVFVYLRQNGLEDLFNPKTSKPAASASPATSSTAATAATSTTATGATSTPSTTGTVVTPTPSSNGSAATAPSATKDAGAAATTANPSPSQPVAPGDTSSLLASEGLLVVQSSATAGVYLNGRFIGVTNQPIKVPCGTRNVRLAELTDPPKPAPGVWLSPGGAVIVACKASTTAKVEPGPSPPPTP